jgi:two-component system CheB/CheR fusion protein
VSEVEGALPPEGDIEPLLEYLKESRGFDFSGYKRPTLGRRVRKRMVEVGAENYLDYQDHLEANPREFTELFNTILINVTAFFRDKPAWDFLAEEVLPKLVEAIPDESPIRVWSAGCASGEEAYTIAILLAEILGEDVFKQRVKIYATDIDEEALAEARAATYTAKALAEVPEEFRARYFVESGRDYSFRPDLRRSVIFGRNELLEDAPISKIDLLICRNVLMYFTVEAQSRILAQFNFALRDHGYLFLGKSEMLIRHADYFNPVELKWRVFQRISQGNLRERFAQLDIRDGGDATIRRHADLRQAASQIGPVARIVVDAGRFLVDASDRARDIFEIGPADLGRPLQDLELSYRPLDLRSPLDRAFERGMSVKAGQVKWRRNGEERVFEVEVTPVFASRPGGPLGAAITFSDVTDFARLESEHGASKKELETAYEELQSTVEELETTNEELQSTNEELETTNEELQSANEELQTMNEELTSTNDELESMNEEQHTHTLELDRVNMFLEGILGNLGVGVAVVDRECKVQLWNANSHDLWGLQPNEVEGQDLYSLDIGLPVQELREPVQEVLGGAEMVEKVVEAVNRRGRPFRCGIRVMRLLDATGELYGAIVLMREADDSDVL